MRLHEGLRKLDSALDVAAHHQKKEVTMRYDPARVTPDRIPTREELDGADGHSRRHRIRHRRQRANSQS